MVCHYTLLNKSHWLQILGLLKCCGRTSYLQCLLQFAHKQLLSEFSHTFFTIFLNPIIFFKSIISGPVGPEHNK